MRKATRRPTLTPRQWGLAATATCALLAPTLLHSAAGFDWVNVAAHSGIEAMPPGAGDVLGTMRLQDSGALGVNGRLPETDELSAALLADADDPSSFGDDLPFDGADPDLVAGQLGIPGVMLDAYMKAADRLATTTPGCNLHWSLLAGIGRIESGHARGGRVDGRGNTVNPILGPVLDGGPGMAAIHDTDGGRFDYDRTWDRAVGPMQFIPSTWAGFAADGNDDGESNPNNVYDATAGAGNYLCSDGGDLTNPEERAKAVFRYNRSDEYVKTVLFWADAYADGVSPLPSLPGSDDDFLPPEDDEPWEGPNPPDNGTGTTPPSSTTNPASNPTTTTTTTTSTSSTTTTTTTRTSITWVPPLSSTTSSTTTTVPTTTTSATSTTTTTTTTTCDTPAPTTTTTTVPTTTSVPPTCTTVTTATVTSASAPAGDPSAGTGGTSASAAGYVPHPTSSLKPV
ncbi:lytic murein transglycosylase [Actinosynnema sp. NPDC023587]|uniref:lytic transglycosylase domain-containing protein n=1 Tax=Actinosynnema sp. NPDC023587 TaxID=3154695 RepID=UPI0033E87C71